jgi:hypothetical protein
VAPVVAGILAAILAADTAGAARSDGIDASILAPGLVQANQAIARLQRLTEEAEAIGTAMFRVHNSIGEKRAFAAKPPDCKTDWLLDLGARSRELGRAFRDAVQSARVQARRVENMTVEPTVAPLVDPETNHKVTTLLERVDNLVRGYPEASTWQQRYVEPLLKGCEPELVKGTGFPDPVPGVDDRKGDDGPASAKKAPLVAVIAIGGGFLCPGAVPAAGVMLVSGSICYSDSEACDCEPSAVSPATVLGPEAKAGSAN